MKKLNAKNKIILATIAWLIASGAMLFHFFGILDSANQVTVLSIETKKKELQTLQAQNQSYLHAKADLKLLADQRLQPEDFFSRDITLVNELKILEALKQRFGLETQISGISGTISNAAKAKTTTALVTIPYAINVTGSLGDVVNFIETLENLSFITNVTNITISAAENNKVTAGMSATFYLRK